MQRHVRADVLDHLLRHRFQLLLGVVLARDQQVGDLKLDAGVLLQIDERLEDRLDGSAPRCYDRAQECSSSRSPSTCLLDIRGASKDSNPQGVPDNRERSAGTPRMTSPYSTSFR